MPNDFVRGFWTEIHHGSDFFQDLDLDLVPTFLSKMDVLKLHWEGGNRLLGTWGGFKIADLGLFWTYVSYSFQLTHVGFQHRNSNFTSL